MLPSTAVGRSEFERIRRGNFFYMDKTRFLLDWWYRGDDVTLLTRPRRFGKTLMISTVEAFFSLQFADRGELFAGLAAAEDPDFMKLQGTWPVIRISFADVREPDFDKAIRDITRILTNLYDQNRYLLSRDVLSDSEKTFFRSVRPDMKPETAACAVGRLSSFLSRYYKKKVIFLLDAYDTPLQEAALRGYWPQWADFMYRFFRESVQFNPGLERTLITGLAGSPEESVFSSLDHLEVITDASEKYAGCFGFVPEEVDRALGTYGLMEKREDVRRWYGGYTIGSLKDVYNPWSVLHFLNERRCRIYWMPTGEGSLIYERIWNGSALTKRKFETLIAGKPQRVTLDEAVSYEKLPVKEDALWGMLYADGFLRVTDHEWEDATGKEWYTVTLTNREVRMLFFRIVRSWFSDRESSYEQFIEALKADDLRGMNEYLNRVMAAVSSEPREPRRYRINTKQMESFIHAFVLSLMADLSGDYIFQTNPQSGYGQYDVILEPQKKDRAAIIFCFKIFDPENERNLSWTAEFARRHIVESGYITSMEQRGFPLTSIHAYGAAFTQFQVLIERQNSFVPEAGPEGFRHGGYRHRAAGYDYTVRLPASGQSDKQFINWFRNIVSHLKKAYNNRKERRKQRRYRRGAEYAPAVYQDQDRRYPVMAFFDNLGDRLSTVGKQGVDKAREIRDTSRLSMDIRSEENTVQKLYAEIGKLYYDEHKDDAEPKYGQILEIRAALQKIHDLQNEKMNIKGMVRCSHCGKPVSRTAAFCPNCGTKVVVPEEDEPVTGDVVNENGETVHEAAAEDTAAGAKPETSENPAASENAAEAGSGDNTAAGAKPETAENAASDSTAETEPEGTSAENSASEEGKETGSAEKADESAASSSDNAAASETGSAENPAESADNENKAEI